MPPQSVDPERLLALGAALDPLREVAREGADEALGHFPEVGDREAQQAVDGLLEQLADTLRAIDAEAAELAGRLRIAAQSTGRADRQAVDRAPREAGTGRGEGPAEGSGLTGRDRWLR